MRQLLTGAEEQHAHAFFFEAQRRGDLAMLEALHVSEPEQKLLLRFELAKKTQRIAVAPRICNRLAAQKIPKTPAAFSLHTPPMVGDERRRDLVKVGLQRRICGCNVVESSVIEWKKIGP